jgi:hypothetical protein
MSSSILASYQRTGHSADVKMHLVLDGKTISIGQMGPDFLILDSPIDHPPANAVLFFSIDGNESQREIHLPEGISAKSPRVPIAKPTESP